MWWMAAYGALVIGRYALGVAAVNEKSSTIPGSFLLPFYTTDVKFYP
jgi:hypothetical protein